MTSMMQRPDSEEAKKELLATIHASRELGPEMDDTLTDRFIEKLTSLRPAGSFDAPSTRSKLELLLQSARGSDPVGDSAIADSFLAGLQPPRAVMSGYGAYGGAPAPVEFGPMVRYRDPQLAQIAPMIVFAAIFIVALVVSHGALWWLFWIIPACFGWSRRGYYNNQRRLYRDQQRAYRHNRIVGPEDPYHPNNQLPPQRPPEII